MELWIRSQDRERLVKINNAEIQHHYSYKDAHEKYLLPNGNFEYRNVQKKDKYIKSVIMCNDEIFLGEYKTKERALEVLDEIQNILKPKYILNASSIKPNGDYYEKNGEIYQDYSADARIEQLNIYVYEMPEK